MNNVDSKKGRDQTEDEECLRTEDSRPVLYPSTTEKVGNRLPIPRLANGNRTGQGQEMMDTKTNRSGETASTGVHVGRRCEDGVV